MSSSSFSGLHPSLTPYADYLLAYIRQRDPTARVSSVRRSSSEQRRLYNRFLAGLSIYPAAPPGKSKHEGQPQWGGYSVAFDIVANAAALAAGGKLWESWGGRWGGRFNDPIHFEA